MSFEHFSRQTDIVADRGAVCTQKGSASVYWILGRLHAKNQGLKSRDQKDISLYTDQLTDRQTHMGS